MSVSNVRTFFDGQFADGLAVADLTLVLSGVIELEVTDLKHLPPVTLRRYRVSTTEPTRHVWLKAKTVGFPLNSILFHIEN